MQKMMDNWNQKSLHKSTSECNQTFVMNMQIRSGPFLFLYKNPTGNNSKQPLRKNT